MRNKLFNLEIDNLTLLEALEKIDDLIASGGCHHVVTANPEILYRALSDKGLYETIAQASLVTADGQGVLLAGKLLDQPFKARVTGIDLAEALCATSGERGHKIYFLGGKEGISKKAQMAILRRYPNANIVGEHHGYFKNDIDKAYYLTGYGTREQFAKLYKTIYQFPEFDIRYKLKDLATYLNIQQILLVKMIQVFEELGFVTIKDGVMTVNKEAPKREIAESQIYQNLKQTVKDQEMMALGTVQEMYDFLME